MTCRSRPAAVRSSTCTVLRFAGDFDGSPCVIQATAASPRALMAAEPVAFLWAVNGWGLDQSAEAEAERRRVSATSAAGRSLMPPRYDRTRGRPSGWFPVIDP